MLKEDILKRIGEVRISNEGCKFTIKEMINSRDYTIQFEDGFLMCGVSYVSIESGKIKNPYHRSVYGIGYSGVGAYKLHIDKKVTPACQIWKGILGRGYNQKIKEKQPTYKDVTVCEDWHNFQNFAQWYEDNWKPYMQNWALDKDILVKGNKIYSPDTCVFVPQEINNLFLKNNKTRGCYPVGVHEQKGRYYASISKNNKQIRLGGFKTANLAFQTYKIEKEEHIKDVANKWKLLITERLYNTLINYEVKEND